DGELARHSPQTIAGDREQQPRRRAEPDDAGEQRVERYADRAARPSPEEGLHSSARVARVGMSGVPGDGHAVPIGEMRRQLGAGDLESHVAKLEMSNRARESHADQL